MNSARLRFHSLRDLCSIILCLAFLTPTASPQAQGANSASALAQVSHSSAARAKIKAIWEPLNYPDDIALEDVYFANDQVGWVSGKGSGGFILHTADGGTHWEIQLGDPHSNNPDINSLRFLDATHGWAYQGGGQLLRTTDGKTWETVGPFAPNITQYRFVTVRDGFEVAGDFRGSTIYATHDGGHSWHPVFQCTTTLQVNGLMTNTSCFLRDVFFASPRVGYAVGGGFNDPWAVIAKTSDGGATWKVIFASTNVDTASAAFFTDENNGVVRLHDKRVLMTADGGQSWRGATGSAEASIKFADPEVGWSCIEQYGPSCSITVDGGKSWTTHDIGLPADIQGYSVPRRDRVYVVGDHGMIYRYRIVPADYMAKGIVDGALVPGYGGPIVTQLQQMQAQVTALQSQLSAAGTSSSSVPGAAADTTAGAAGQVLCEANAPAAGGFSQSASTGAGFAQATSAQSSASSAAPAGQNTTAPGGFSQGASAAGGFTQDTSAAAVAGFTQDVSAAPSSQFVQNCCASQVQGLQTSFTAVAQQVPTFSGQFKNLNLLFVGLTMLNDMMCMAEQTKDSFVALKNAPNAPTAIAALSNLAANLQGTSNAITTQFQGLSSAPASTAAGGAFENQVGGAPAAASAAAVSGQPANPSTAGSQSSVGAAAGAAAGTAVDKLKKKLPSFPF